MHFNVELLRISLSHQRYSLLKIYTNVYCCI